MKAYIEVYEKGSVIKICGDDDTVINRFEVAAIHVEVSKQHAGRIFQESGDRTHN